MVQPGRDSPGKEVKDTSPSPSPKWVFRPTNAKRNIKKSATPHPVKTGGNTERSACVPLTETGRVRKKIVFEFEELIAGTNGGGSAIGGEDGGAGSSPITHGGVRFSMGQKDGSAKHQPEVVTGTRMEGELPEVNDAVAQGVLRSTHVGAAASAAVMDEDTSSEMNGANILFEPPTLAAPFPEKDRYVLASETCDTLKGQSFFEVKFGDGTNFEAEDNNGGGEAGLDGKPSASDNSPDSPHKLLDQDTDQPEIQPDHSTSEVGNEVTSPVERPLTSGHTLEFIADQASQAETQPVESALDEKPPNSGDGLDSGGTPKSDAVNLDADHDTEMGTSGWCEGIPSLTFSSEETKCLVDKGQEKAREFDHRRQGVLNPPPRPTSPTFADYVWDEGFIKQGGKGRRGKQGNIVEKNIKRSNSANQVILVGKHKEAVGVEGRIYLATTENLQQGNSVVQKLNAATEWVLQQFEESNPFQQLEHEEYMVEEGRTVTHMEEETWGRRKSTTTGSGHHRTVTGDLPAANTTEAKRALHLWRNPTPTRAPPEAVFQSAGEAITNASIYKKEARRSVGERLRLRRSTPRQTMKGIGNKQFITTPSPWAKPKFKRAAAKEEEENITRSSKYKKNLLEELNLAKDMSGQGLDDEDDNKPEDGGKSIPMEPELSSLHVKNSSPDGALFSDGAATAAPEPAHDPDVDEDFVSEAMAKDPHSPRRVTPRCGLCREEW
ncbi:hypothetical protein SASPL_105154 [Salvia splendens]|uniref:Uncharacterized protein n=1 Tax=Salvia splendens TaxID=180675 RepID=A0A8X8YKS5_SALSN|nr:hypothetical protein SASPL_105154 [Salvia splendens]